MSKLVKLLNEEELGQISGGSKNVITADDSISTTRKIQHGVIYLSGALVGGYHGYEHARENNCGRLRTACYVLGYGLVGLLAGKGGSGCIDYVLDSKLFKSNED